MEHVTSPRTDDEGIEATLRNKSNAPRVTAQRLEDRIAATFTFNAFDAVDDTEVQTMNGLAIESLSLLTIAVLVLRNGFTVVGTSACASPENYDSSIGRALAVADAKNKIWPLEGYLLKEQLAMDQLARLANAPQPRDHEG